LAAFNSANRLFLLYTAQLAFRNEPALAADGAEHSAFYDLLAEALQQLILRFIRPKNNMSQGNHLPPILGVGCQRDKKSAALIANAADGDLRGSVN